MKRRTGTQGLRQHGFLRAQSCGKNKENSDRSKGRKIHEGAFFIMSAPK
jgi:hypothetical protein